MKILLHDEAQLLDWGESRATGPWIKLRLNNPELLECFRGMDTATQKKTGHILNLTLSEGDILEAVEESPTLDATEEQPSSYGQEAAKLRTTGFFYRPEVWRAIGSDADFQDWIRLRKCVVCGEQDWVESLGEGRCEYAHVRRGSGVGIKPEYSGVPMCNEHHRLQHAKGEQAAYHETQASIGLPKAGTEQEAREWFEKKAIQAVTWWAWIELKKQLGAESWKDIEPSRLRIWAENEAVEQYLPDIYKNAHI